MVDAALEASGGKERRLRLIPSRVVVYLLLAGALFDGQGWRSVWSRLTSALPQAPRRPCASALTEAMRRVGPAPLRELFTLLAGPAGSAAPQRVRFAGRLVVAIDGTQLAIADTEANRNRFPKPRPGPNGQAGYPTIRLVAIVATGTRAIIDAAFGTDRVGELAYASTLTGALRAGMLLLADRNFATYQFLAQVAGTGADLLIRAKSGHGAMRLPVLKRLPDGSYLSSAKGMRVRVVEAVVTITTKTGSRASSYRLITTMLDPVQAPAAQLVQLYHQRWEIETAYCELKSTILGGRVLRARHPSGVEQELWALLCTYQALRIAISDALLHRPDINPDRASFTVALHAARDQIIQTAGIIAETSINLVGRIGAAVLTDLLPARRTRTRQRVIKRAISKYRAKGDHIDRRTHPATLHTRILTPEPDD